MAFPTIPTVAANRLLISSQSTATTTHTFPSLTTLAQAAGDILLAIIVTYQGGSANAEFSAWGGSFQEFIDQSTNSTTIQSIGAAYKFSDGNETGTFTVTTVASTRSVMFLLAIPGAHASTLPEATAKANGTSAAADPAALDPTNWAAEDTLWIAVAVNGETSLTGSFTGITAAPTNYTDYAQSGIIGGDVIGALEGALGFRQLNASSEDVGTFTLDVGAAGNSALLIAVRPAAAIALTVDAATQAQTVDNIVLTQHHVLVVQNATQAMTSDGAGGGDVVRESTTVTLDNDGTPSVQASVPNCVVGDILLIFHGNNFYALSAMPEPTVTGSPDVTPITNGAADAGTNFAHVKSYWTEVNTAGTNVVSVTEDNPGDEEKSLVVHRLSSVKVDDPIVDADHAESATTQTTHVAPSVDGLDGGMLIIHNNSGSSDWAASYSFPGSMTEQYDANDGTFYSHTGATESLTADGATGTRTLTPNETALFGLVVVSVRPASGLTLTEHEVFTAFAANQAMTSDSPNLVQHHVLVVDNATQAQTVDSPSLTQNVDLTVANAAQAQTVDNVILVQHHVLSISAAVQAQTSESPSLTQNIDLAVNAAIQAQMSDNVTLVQHHVLSVDNANQSQTSDSPALVQHHILVVANATQAQTVDNIVVTHNEGFSVQSAFQGQTVDNIVLTQHHQLLVNNAAQGQIIENVTLTQDHILSVADAHHSQTVDNFILIQDHILVVSDANHAQISESPTLEENLPGSLEIRQAAFMTFF